MTLSKLFSNPYIDCVARDKAIHVLKGVSEVVETVISQRLLMEEETFALGMLLPVIRYSFYSHVDT